MINGEMKNKPISASRTVKVSLILFFIFSLLYNGIVLGGNRPPLIQIIAAGIVQHDFRSAAVFYKHYIPGKIFMLYNKSVCYIKRPVKFLVYITDFFLPFGIFR